MTVYVDEFLYRGRPPGDAREPAWHLVLGDATKDAFGNATVSLSGVMPMEQAAAAGYNLPGIIAEINAEAVAQFNVMKSTVDDLNTQLENFQSENASLKSTILDLQAATPEQKQSWIDRLKSIIGMGS